MSDHDLRAYREERDLRRTPEPAPSGGEAGARPRFVIQEHRASSHHYDFRLQVEGVLKSWAVPKGPSTDPAEKRLALPTEDHPIEHADFEGVIPQGQYGAGTVIVWDAGPYRNLNRDESGDELALAEAVRRGHLKVWLEGEKLRGGYALIRTSSPDEEERWLLVKMDDAEADARRNPTSTEPRSVLTGRTVDDLAEESST